MALTPVRSLAMGGVNDSHHPLDFPIARSVRCKNWVPKANGRLQLRYGYTLPTMSTVSAADIHSAAYFETWAGTQYILFSQSTALKQMAVSGGAVTALGTLTSGNQWGHFRANNKLHLSNATDFKSYDGTALRNNGIRAPLSTDFAALSTIGTPATATDAGGGAVAWNSVGNVLASDNANATCTLAYLDESNWIHVSSLGLSVPVGSLITNVSIIIEWTSSGGATPNDYLTAYVIKAGTRQGSGMALVNSTVGTETITTINALNGGVSLTAADVNANNFGAALKIASLVIGNFLRSVDQIRVQVDYTTAVAVSASTATPGSFSTTSLSGYQLYMAYYNPNTGHVGNRMAVGTRTTVAGSGYSLVLTGLPNISAINSEWLKVIGRTPDGGEVPYWFIDTNADYVTVGNTATTATITCPDVNYDSELPTRNSVGSGFTAFAKIGGRIFAIKSADPYIYYSEDESDAVSGSYVGRPEESWPANNAEAFPTGGIPISIHEHGKDGWFFSKDHLIRWRESLRLQLVEPWVGPWPVGCGGQRLFVSTPYGPFWLSGTKRLMTFTDTPLEVSGEYQRTLLARISNANLSDAEMIHEYDPDNEIDRLRIVGLDSGNLPVVILHDFLLRDPQSTYGQAYEETYAATITTLVGSGYSPFVPVRDTNGKRQSWAGLSTGRFAQLNDGTADNAATYSADYISGPIFLGKKEIMLSDLDYVGDGDVTISHSNQLSDTLAEFQNKTSEDWKVEDSRYKVKISSPADYHRLRFQLTSHPSDGNFTVGEPYSLPLNDYGIIYEVGFNLGAGRQEGRG